MFSMQMKHALQGKTELFQNVVVDWMWIGDDQSFDDVDFSDDDIVDRCQVLMRQNIVSHAIFRCELECFCSVLDA